MVTPQEIKRAMEVEVSELASYCFLAAMFTE
jgi:hypothetical protein